MERTAVQSRDIALVGYDVETATLEVVFRAGGVYQYEKVPADVYQNFLTAPSHGNYFREHIREHYAYQKISG